MQSTVATLLMCVSWRPAAGGRRLTWLLNLAVAVPALDDMTENARW
ncbi:hypothetical protein [Shinella sp.]